MTSRTRQKSSPSTAEESQESRYKLWRRYIPLLYDFVSTQVFDWPASCIELIDPSTGGWLELLDDVEWREGSRLIIAGTYTGDSKEDSIEIFKTDLPPPCDYTFDSSTATEEVIAKNRVRTTEIASIAHDDEVLTCRAMPQRTTLLASRSSSATFLYDFSGSVREPTKTTICDTAGISLSWSRLTEGHLLIGCEDGTIVQTAVDVQKKKKSDGDLSYKLEPGTITCLEWHPSDPTVFASSSINGRICLWDIRTKDPTTRVKDAHGSDFGVNCLSFCPLNPTNLLSGVGWRENTQNNEMNTPDVPEVQLWDVRNMDRASVRKFVPPNAHAMEEELGSQVYQTRWSPYRSNQFACCSGDGRIRIWDIDKVNVAFEDPREVDDGPSELIFVHGGHTDAVSDCQWDPKYKDTLVSVADDNICMFWRPLC